MDCMALSKWIRWLYFHGLGGSATMEYSNEKNPYDVLAFTLTQKCSAQCEKQVSLFTGGTCFACFNIEGI